MPVSFTRCRDQVARAKPCSASIIRPAKIPIFLATLAPKALAYTGETADGWLGTSFSPDHAEAHLAHIRKGAGAVGRSLNDIALHATCTVAIGQNVDEC